MPIKSWFRRYEFMVLADGKPNITVWKQDMELVTAEFEVFGRVSFENRLAYGRQEANKGSGRYVDVPKLDGCS